MKFQKESSLIYGLFFLSFATYGYILFGNLGKYFSLILGFLLIFYTNIYVPFSKKDYVFLVLSILSFIFLLVIEILGDHELSKLNFVFSIICLLLFYLGYRLSRLQWSKVIQFRSSFVYIIPLLSIAGFVFLLNFQSNLLSSERINFRGYGEDSELNAVAISFVSGLIFIINFSIFRGIYNLSKINRTIIIISLFLAILVMISTLSKGGLFFLFFLLLIYFFVNYRKLFLNNNFVLKSVLFVFLFSSIFFVLYNYSSFFNDRLNNSFYRFEDLFRTSNSEFNDQSTIERIDKFSFFVSNFSNFIFFGLHQYKPYPHNQFLEILLRWGLLGVPVLILSIFSLLKSLIIIKKLIIDNNPVVFLILGLFLFSYFQSMTSLSLEMNRMMWFGFGFIYGYRL